MASNQKVPIALSIDRESVYWVTWINCNCFPKILTLNIFINNESIISLIRFLYERLFSSGINSLQTKISINDTRAVFTIKMHTKIQNFRNTMIEILVELLNIVLE